LDKKFFYLISIYYFLFFALIGDYVIFLPKYFSAYFSPSQIGIIFSMMPIARFLMPFVFLKKPLTKNDFILSIFISVTSSFLLFSKNFYLISLFFFILGASFAVIFPYIESVAIEKLKEKYGKSRLYGSIGFMLFGIVGGYVSFNLLIAFVLMLIITNLFSFVFLEDKTIKKSASKFNLFKEWKFWAAVVFLQISFGGFYSFFTIYVTSHGISKEWVGWLFAIGVTAEIIVFLIQHRFINKKHPLFWIKLSVFLTSLRWLILFLFPSDLILIAASQLIHAFSFALFHTSALLYLNKTYENKTLAQQFYAGIAYGIAAFLGSMLAGFLYGENLFLYESIIALLGFLVML
jgi:PPP family 3-phenylpropionic acid transporter